LEETDMRTFEGLALVAVVVLGCTGTLAGDGATLGDGGGGGGDDAGGPRADVPFVGPDVSTVDGAYVPQPGNCGFPAGTRPAFCETFESGPSAGGPRTGDLDPARWSANRYPSEMGPALLPQCRAGLSNTMALPDRDTVICDPTPTIRTRHLLTATAAQNYGLNTYRVRQPFDFAGRTGVIKFDVELVNALLYGWPSIAISEDPTPAPSINFPERGSGPRNGIEIHFNTGCNNEEDTVAPVLYGFRDFVERQLPSPEDCPMGATHTAPGALNHVEIYLTQSRIEIWMSDASLDGVTFPNFHRVWGTDIDLPFSRGYVHLTNHNHATIKYWSGAAWLVRWDNVGFDGPVVTNVREYSVANAAAVTHGLPGCRIGGSCEWVGTVIPAHDETVCDAPAEQCVFPGEGRDVGYTMPDSAEPPRRLEISGVNRAGVTRARLVFASSYLVEPDRAAAARYTVRYRLNGGTWHDHVLTRAEIDVFFDHAESTGLLNLALDVPVGELRDGNNTVELATANVPQNYPPYATGVDLVLTTSP
jgi:hypothetical protein